MMGNYRMWRVFLIVYLWIRIITSLIWNFPLICYSLPLGLSSAAHWQHHHCFIHPLPLIILFSLGSERTAGFVPPPSPCFPPPLCFLPRGVPQCFWGSSRLLAERSDGVIDLIDAAGLVLWFCLYLYTVHCHHYHHYVHPVNLHLLES